jgi:glycosyltransferase involved in cell wall biosynthesis
MRIALISTCAVAVPPKAYGGTELVTAELAKMLTRLGHSVTVYATGDSRPAGALRYRFEERVWPPDAEAELQHAAFAWRHIARANVDVVHAHQPLSVAFAPLFSVPTVLTLHDARIERRVSFLLDFPDVLRVAISERQAALVPELDVQHVVHHGLDAALYELGPGAGGYCAFLGRLAVEKGPHVAIDAARQAGVPLRLAGSPHPPDRDYFAREVAVRLDSTGATARAVGELSLAPKVELLRHAMALLFPIAWEEPFGLAMIEAMMVGTPVIAFPRGSVPEVVEEGLTGFIVRDTREMALRLRQLDGFDRSRCRARAVERWSSMRMARDYEAIYDEMLRRGVISRRGSGAHRPERTVRGASALRARSRTRSGDV